MISRKEITGADRAAIFLLSVGPEVAAPILGSLDDHGLVELAKRMPKIRDVSPETIQEIYAEFIQMHNSGDSFFPPPRTRSANC